MPYYASYPLPYDWLQQLHQTCNCSSVIVEDTTLHHSLTHQFQSIQLTAKQLKPTEFSKDFNLQVAFWSCDVKCAESFGALDPNSSNTIYNLKKLRFHDPANLRHHRQRCNGKRLSLKFSSAATLSLSPFLYLFRISTTLLLLSKKVNYESLSERVPLPKQKFQVKNVSKS